MPKTHDEQSMNKTETSRRSLVPAIIHCLLTESLGRHVQPTIRGKAIFTRPICKHVLLAGPSQDVKRLDSNSSRGAWPLTCSSIKFAII